MIPKKEGTVYIHGGIKDTSNGESFRQDRINHLYSINLKIPKLKVGFTIISL